jgi:two-component system OmpR family sensor kinase
MTLTNRLTVFFLTGLAAILVAFSVTLYALARSHLEKYIDDRATATLDTLIAAAEVEPWGLEWEPKEHKLLLRSDRLDSVWAIFTEQGRRIDGSPESPLPLGQDLKADADLEKRHRSMTWENQQWYVVQRTLRLPDRAKLERGKQRVLVFVVALSAEPINDLLRRLAGVLTLVSGLIWLGAAFSGRWLCRRALAPVNRMAEQAKEMRVEQLGERLAVPAARDELYDLAVAFNGLLTRVQEAFERQKQFTGEASHQLRTPLTAMLGQMEVALRRERTPEEYRRVLNETTTQAERLQSLIEMLLFLARADADGQHLPLEEIALGRWLTQHLRETWDSQPRWSDIHLEVSDPDLQVRTHAALLGQALDNLVDNACKYSPVGTPIHIRLEHGNERRLVVDDEGPGIRTDERRHIFTPFFRSADARLQGIVGVGLGLAVTARIVATLGGRIHWEAGERGGSRFVITLPV